MSKLHSALVVYGAVDDAVAKARDKRIVDLLTKEFKQPRTLGDRGWYTQVQQVAQSQANAGFKRLDDALVDLASVTLAQGTTPDGNAFTAYDLRRLYYFTGILAQLKAVLVEGSSDQLLVEFDDDKLEAVRQAIRAATPDYDEPPSEGKSSVREVNGEYATVLLTSSYNKDISVDQLKNVLYPPNWPKVSSFFIAMEDEGFDSRGWRQLIEVIGTGVGAGFHLRTPLKFYMGELADGSVYVNYDMVDQPAAFDGDNLVVIDNGYIVATPEQPGHPEADGVRLHTSKELLIRGMSPTAAANLADRLGWADAGDRMFFEGATREGLAPWVNSSPADATGPGADIEVQTPPWALPPGNRKQIIDTAQQTANSVLDSTARAFGTFAERWQDGITPEDIVSISADLGDELTRTYESMFNTAIDAVRPAPVPVQQEAPS